MLSSRGVKREKQPEGQQPATKVFVHAHSQLKSQTETFQDNLDQAFSKSSKLSLESPVEPHIQEHHSSQLLSELEATSGLHPRVLPQLHDKSPSDHWKDIYQVQQAEVKQPLLSSVVVRKVQMKPQAEVHLISVDSSKTSSFGPSNLQDISVKSSQNSGFGPSGPLKVISADSSQTSGFEPLGPLQVTSAVSSQTSGFGPLGPLQVISAVSSQTSGFGPSGPFQVISVESSQTSGFEPSGPLQVISAESSQTSGFGPSGPFQVIPTDSSQTSGFGRSGPLQVISAESSQTSGFGPSGPFQGISVESSQTSGFGPSGTLQVISEESSQTSGFGPSGTLQVISTDSSQTSGFGSTDLQVIYTDLGQTSGIEPSEILQSTSSANFSQSILPKSSAIQTSFASPHKRERVLARSFSFPQPNEPSQTQSPSSPVSCPSTCLDTPVTVTQLRTPIKQHLCSPTKWEPQTSVTTQDQRPIVLAKSHSFSQASEAQGVPYVPVRNEVYARAQALARSRLDKAKQHLHEHIQDVITVISTRDKSKQKSKKKQASFKIL